MCEKLTTSMLKLSGKFGAKFSFMSLTSASRSGFYHEGYGWMYTVLSANSLQQIQRQCARSVCSSVILARRCMSMPRLAFNFVVVSSNYAVDDEIIILSSCFPSKKNDENIIRIFFFANVNTWYCWLPAYVPRIYWITTTEKLISAGNWEPTLGKPAPRRWHRWLKVIGAGSNRHLWGLRNAKKKNS